MSQQISRIEETLQIPDRIIKSITDSQVELFYKQYDSTPVGVKFLCVVVKSPGDDYFIITAYFTDSLKKGRNIWTKK